MNFRNRLQLGFADYFRTVPTPDGQVSAVEGLLATC